MSRSFKDIRFASRSLMIKSKSAGPWGEGKPEAVDGVCPECKQYDIELDAFGFCRDDDCKRNRLIKALHTGEAVRTTNGEIIWTHGIKIK